LKGKLNVKSANSFVARCKVNNNVLRWGFSRGSHANPDTEHRIWVLGQGFGAVTARLPRLNLPRLLWFSGKPRGVQRLINRTFAESFTVNLTFYLQKIQKSFVHTVVELFRSFCHMG
jgi:hypothetical protein